MDGERMTFPKKIRLNASDLNTECAARRSVNVLLNMMERFIPRACHREAADVLMVAMLEHGFELTSKQMRQQYEVLQSAALSIRRLSGDTPMFVLKDEVIPTS